MTAAAGHVLRSQVKGCNLSDCIITGCDQLAQRRHWGMNCMGIGHSPVDISPPGHFPLTQTINLTLTLLTPLLTLTLIEQSRGNIRGSIVRGNGPTFPSLTFPPNPIHKPNPNSNLTLILTLLTLTFTILTLH